MSKMRSFLLLIIATATAYGGTVTGTLQGPSALPVKNGTLSFGLQQAGLIVGTGGVVPTGANCYTSADGSVVGIPNPLTLPSVSTNYGSGTLSGGTYYVVYAFYSGSLITLASPEIKVQLTSTGSLIVSPPVSFPPNATGMTVFIGTTPGGETGQGTTITPTSGYTQGVPLGAGIPLPSTNNSPCTIAFNDTIIPYSGYNVSLISSSGNSYPGWPQAWQLNGGANGTVNISNGAPLWNGTIIYPMPILAQPLNHGPQSISGPLNMTGYNLVNVGAIGVGTSTPAWPIDVENGLINSSGGYLFNGGAGTSGQCLVSNGTYFGPGSCGTLPTLYYQRLQGGGVLKAQEPFANFDGSFNVQDNPGSTRTDIGLAQTGVTAGSYTNTNLTVDQFGRLSAATSGPALTVIKPLIVNSGICTTGTSAYANCNFTVTWPSAFADSSYAVTCSAAPQSGVLTSLFVSNQTATTFEITLQNGSASGAVATTVSQIDCIGVHP